MRSASKDSFMQVLTRLEDSTRVEERLGDSLIKWGRMLVVSLRCKFRFWSHLGCSGQNEVSFKGLNLKFPTSIPPLLI